MIDISSDKKFTEKTALIFIVMSLIIGAIFGNVIGYNRGYHDGFDLRDSIEPHRFDGNNNNEVVEPTLQQTEDKMYWYVVLENGNIITYPPGTDEWDICTKHFDDVANCTFVWESPYQGEVKRRTHFIGEI